MCGLDISKSCRQILVEFLGLTAYGSHKKMMTFLVSPVQNFHSPHKTISFALMQYVLWSEWFLAVDHAANYRGRAIEAGIFVYTV